MILNKLKYSIFVPIKKKILKIIHKKTKVFIIHADKFVMSKMLSKSKIKDNSKCSMMLWHELNQPELKVWDSSNLFRFDQGRKVEQIARDKFPGAVLQDKQANLEKLAMTQDLLKLKKTIFEAAFLHDNVIVQFDMLTENSDGSFNAVEVKSSASFKEDYELDVIVQYWVATYSGIKIKEFVVWHINSESTNLDNYFSAVDVMPLVLKSEERFKTELKKAQATFNSKEAPVVKIGAHCDKFECAFQGTPQCKLEVEKNSVLNLPRFNKKWEAHDTGFKIVDDKFTDEYSKYHESNPLVIKSVMENKLIINSMGIKKDISEWKMPYNFFDFETLMSAIPILDNQKPYEQVVFQFSNHIYRGEIKMEHQMFLHDTLKNPDQDVIKHLLSFLNNEGSIVAYNKTFEETRIAYLAKKYPENKEALLSLIPRFVDLMEVVKNNVYHPDFLGSYSLKSVSPTLLKEFGSYSDSLIKSGGEIASYYTEMLTTTDSVRKEEIKKALFRYCQYDTLNLFLLMMYLLDQNVNLAEIVKVNLE